MATSSCPKCSSTSFEMKEAPRVASSAYRLMFVQCTSCGSVVGVSDYYNIPSLLEKIAVKLGVSIF